ncbi:hydroxyphenylacetyl-CoA thioesterase PaaI [Raoultella ornithinolytica]
MYEKDTCARTLGIEIIEMDDGYAQMSMTVSSAMLNGHQTCHGGQLFSLADTAFAYACNSQGLAAVASAASIDFLRPAFAGDRLVATARVKQQGKKVLLIADYPGLLVWRTLAMLINEALDAVQKGVASPEDIDTAMRLGVNYPHGPLAWGESLGWQRVLRLLENLQQHYGEERYRPGSLLRQKALVEKRNEQ